MKCHPTLNTLTKPVMMKQILAQIKPYQTYLLAVLTVFFFMRSCNRGREIGYLKQDYEVCITLNDSLEAGALKYVDELKLLQMQRQEELVERELQVHRYYSDEIAKLPRGPQLMEFHKTVVMPNLKTKEAE
jgi:hypothetical protein